MKIDKRRVKRYLYDILSNAKDIEDILKEHNEAEIVNNKHLLKSLKYSLVEISEALSLSLQHILAKHYGIPVKGYIDTIKRASEVNLVPESLSISLRPFLDFRNALVHRYWTIDDERFLVGCKLGYKAFFAFVEAIEKFMEGV